MSEAGSAGTPVRDGLDGAHLAFADVDGIRTRYLADGAGDPLVLISGGQFGSTYSLDCWSLNIPSLAREFRVYALDKLGQGYTDNPPRDEDYAFEAVASHAAGFLRALGIGRAHLVGHSRGALVAALIALEQPDLVRSLTFADSNSLAPLDAGVPYDFYSRIERVPPGGEPTRSSVRAEPEANSYSTEHVTEDWLDRIHAFARLDKVRAAAARVAELRRAIWQPSVERCRERALQLIDAGGLPVPTQVVWGVQDPSAPLPLAHLLFARICGHTRHAELHVINRAGHYAFREHAGTFNRLVSGFCRAVSQGALR